MTTPSGPTRSQPTITPGPLLHWFAEQGRDLPWRASRQPWAVLVSELMLQQTQAARVVERWPRFLEQFPTPTACADASVASVIEAWRGLGYNRRAVNLHRTATIVRDQHGGVMPTDLAELLVLPGIGPYTARAVRVFAQENDDGVVDTNIGRVLARVCGHRLRPSEAQRLADDLVPVGHGWEWNQALMEVGATVCRSTPDCETCPIAASCEWQRAGLVGSDPARGSAAVSTRQSRFEGSDRQGRGRLVDALRLGPVSLGAVPGAMGWPTDPDRANRVAATLVEDGLAVRDAGGFRLPS